jgi:hypothetical protein
MKETKKEEVFLLKDLEKEGSLGCSSVEVRWLLERLALLATPCT